jgi:cytochrome c oxidase accessory protein FixG
MVIFIVVPHLRINGKPPILLDLVHRKFVILGTTFLPTDTLLLAFLMLTAFVSIVLITAITGRAWCGWACPQTVYIEYLFRPIDRLFEGTAGKGGSPKRKLSAPREIARIGVYLVLCMILGHTFLSYFVGTDQLAQWIQGSPFNHPAAFAVMAVTTGLLFYDFYFFREQTCLIACPYGRFQSVMLDRQSMIVAYDYNRGEPRKKGKHQAGDKAGDCVDCNRCVVVCPTGIDIRDGLQMECVNCTQCIDACDDVMQRVGSPTGLIRYSSQDALEGKRKKFLRARTIAYPLVLTAVISGFLFVLSTKYSFDARIIREKGNPYTRVERNLVSNNFKLRLVNRTEQPQQYALALVQPDDAALEIIDDSTLSLEAGETKMVPMQIRFGGGLTFGDGNTPCELQISDSSEHERTIEFTLLGPR